MTANLGPGPSDRSETETAAVPVAATAGRSFGARGSARVVAGLLTVLTLTLIFVLAVGLFRDSFKNTVPVTVISDRSLGPGPRFLVISLPYPARLKLPLEP